MHGTWPAALLLAALLSGPATAVAGILPMTDAMAVSDVVHARVPHSDDFDISMVAEGSYAIAYWQAENGHGAGTALLKKSAGDWHLIKMQGSAFANAQALSALGVPVAQANALIADVAKANSH